ncbi:MAG: cytochrome c [Bacteroidetes Order II. Incertae sedis bacterium]|jgi:mono/diheme cytochrome c family protein|nr:cytochrome c [Bacteroidetes Order II. bacterium]MDG1754597.1 c-type cytochrome [Rhodothermales bacterium]HAY36309.1 quinol:cytochrome C oxidoreductase [Bacteroidota bacterium]MBT4601642.1 cytochrome c [Bacteroidetes Order II. bacterium]MBT5249451.1 cytochrome c [Bacteroidetes Order II. bacterium]
MMNRYTTYSGMLASLLAVVVLTGCQGTISQKEPIHINPNMDWQERFEAQEANPFFADGRAMRAPVKGTVARGFLKENDALWTGKTASGSWASIPVEVNLELLERGRERYDIFCSVCHGLAGDGQGIIMTGGYGYVPAPTFHSEMVRAQADGYLYNALTYGVRSMPGYGTQIPVEDRWAIVAYIRALQRSQNASASDVPENER